MAMTHSAHSELARPARHACRVPAARGYTSSDRIPDTDKDLAFEIAFPLEALEQAGDNASQEPSKRPLYVW